MSGGVPYACLCCVLCAFLPVFVTRETQSFCVDFSFFAACGAYKGERGYRKEKCVQVPSVWWAESQYFCVRAVVLFVSLCLLRGLLDVCMRFSGVKHTCLRVQCMYDVSDGENRGKNNMR